MGSHRRIGHYMVALFLLVCLSGRLLSGLSRGSLLEGVQEGGREGAQLSTSTLLPRHRLLSSGFETPESLKDKFKCKDEKCKDLVVGYFNYLELLYIKVGNPVGRVFLCLMLVVWVLFLLHVVETTTNDYFVTSLQVAVKILDMSPNVAGVTFLAVGNAACDVIASIAAIAVDKNEVGVGTTVGAGIFVTCAVVAAVAFVSDVRLPRRSFIRDVAFCLFTVAYLIYAAWDNYINLGEAIGFMVIYVVFVSVVLGGRYLRTLAGFKDDMDEEDETEEEQAASAAASSSSSSSSQGKAMFTGTATFQGGGGKGGLKGAYFGRSFALTVPPQVIAATTAIKLSPSGETLAGAIFEGIENLKNATLPSTGSSTSLGSSMLGGRSKTPVKGGEDSASSGSASKFPGSPNGRSMLRREYTIGELPNRKRGDFGTSSSSSSASSRAAAAPLPSGKRSTSIFAGRGLAREDSLMGIINDFAIKIVDGEGGGKGGSGVATSLSSSSSSSSSTGSGGGGRNRVRSLGNAWEGGAGGVVGGGGISSVRGMGPLPPFSPASPSAGDGSGGLAILRRGTLGGFGGVGGGKGGKSGTLSGAGMSAAPPPPPTKSGPRRWAAAISQDKYEAFSLPTYHKRKLATSLAAAWASEGYIVRAGEPYVKGPDGGRVNVVSLAVSDGMAAARLLAWVMENSGGGGEEEGGFSSSPTKTTPAATTIAGATGVVEEEGETGEEGGGVDDDLEGGALDTAAATTSPTSPPSRTALACASAYLSLSSTLAHIGPAYSAFMHTVELPLVLLRNLSIPLLQEGEYRRTLAVLNPPAAFGAIALIGTTSIIKGGIISVQGVPLFIWAAMGGIPLSLIAHFFFLPWVMRGSAAEAVASAKGERMGLLESAAAAKAQTAMGASKEQAQQLKQAEEQQQQQQQKKGNEHSEGGHHEGPAYLRWIHSLGDTALGGVTEHPPPTGIVLGLYLLLSFVAALFWLLIIANELVGTALAFGKILDIPDVVMGLGILAVGNSVNDFAASISIARDGFAQMAVAGAYAGPMFNILAGIGLPFLIKIIQKNGEPQKCGDRDDGGQPGANPILWMSYIHLVLALTVTIIWVPLSGFRITTRIGTFLAVWFLLFLVVLVILALVGYS